jgi:hypothetical protein
MRYSQIFLTVLILLSCSSAVRGEQSSAAVASSLAGNPTSVNPAHDCSGGFNELQEAAESADALPGAVHIEQDLNILERTGSELPQCVLATGAQGAAQDSQGACSNLLLLNFEMRHDGEPERDIPIGRLPGSSAFFYESGMTIDADGAPNAYHPDNSGLDDLANAGSPGIWQGLAKGADGEPFIQGPNDPFPGYYVSATALVDRLKAVNDPARYVDATKIPYVVLPGGMARRLGARPGDFAAVFNRRDRKSSYAIFGDTGPSDRVGEGSMALAENLGIRSDPRNGGTRAGIFYLVFPGSGNGLPRTTEEIDGEGQRLLQGWEASITQVGCTVQHPGPVVEGNQPAN